MAKLDKLKNSANTASKSIATSFLSGVQEEIPAPEPVKEQTAKTEPKKKQTKKTPEQIKTPAETPKKSGKKVVIGARALPEDMDAWRDYAGAVNIPMGDLITKAVNEYMKRHKLSEEQQERLDLLKKLREMN